MTFSLGYLLAWWTINTEQHFVTEVESNAVSGYASSLINESQNEIGTLARIAGGINGSRDMTKLFWVFISPTLLIYKRVS